MHTWKKNTNYMFGKSVKMKTNFIFIYPSIKNIKSDHCPLKSGGKSERNRYMMNSNKLNCQEPYIFPEIKCMKHINVLPRQYLISKNPEALCTYIQKISSQNSSGIVSYISSNKSSKN